MPEKQLPRRPSLVHLKYQARDLLDAHKAGDAEAVARITPFLPSSPSLFHLSDAQFVVAREYGFESWSRLRAYVETVASHTCSPHKETVEPEAAADVFLRLACLVYGNDHPSRREQAKQMLAEQPGIRGANLHVAAATGDLETAQALLAANPKLARERGGPNHWEPLLYLAYSRVGFESANWLDTARLLLRHGADPNAAYLWEGSYLFTALTGVFGEGEAGPVNLPEHPECLPLAELLLRAGANPNDSQVLYNRQFVPGARYLELLLEFGLGKPAKDAWSRRLSGRHLQSPSQMVADQLFLAASHGHRDRMELLLDHGADPNLLNRQGRTPYELALLGGHPGIAELLLAHGAQRKDLAPLDAFAAACSRGDRTAALDLLRADASLVGQLGSRQAEMLAAAASGNHLEAMRVMADTGFDLNAMRHSTPLHEAAWNGHLEMVKLLIGRGADATIRDRSHSGLPADWAAHNHRHEVAAYLESLQSSHQP
jgi:ankyrin repeat protein